ncbi:MAG: hypothetical protein J6X83_00060 [Methanomicrobium sp.]|nr:hypothetical protein [Methanomicrobium sp.]
MYEILTLHKLGNPEKDWSVRTTLYKKRGNAERIMHQLLHTGWYQAVILRNIDLQDRDDLIRRMNAHLASDYHQHEVRWVETLNDRLQRGV